MVDVIRIVEILDSMGYIRANRIINSYYQIYCPFHNHGQEHKASFGLLIREEIRNGKVYPTGWAHCFTCSYVNPLPTFIEDVLKAKGVNQKGVDWLKDNVPGYDEAADFDFLIPPSMSEDILNSWDHAKLAVKALSDLNKPKYDFISEEELASYRFTVPYMYERGLTDDVILNYDIGFDQNFRLPGRKEITPTLTFPVRDIFGRTQFIYRRGVSTKLFYMPEGLEKPVYGIYELKQGVRRIVVAEAILNALKCITFGQPAVALMATGNAFQIEQIRKLGAQEIILGFDDDEAGHRAERKWKKALSDVAIVWCYRGYPPKDDGSGTKDLNDLTLSEFKALELV